jgi:hypothetical protein
MVEKAAEYPPSWAMRWTNMRRVRLMRSTPEFQLCVVFIPSPAAAELLLTFRRYNSASNHWKGKSH